MKVLATAARRLGRPSDAECGYIGLIRALRMGGHAVEEGMVAPGQDLSKYDLVLCEVPDPPKVGARLNGALWALGGEDWPAVAVYDHWEIRAVRERLDRRGVEWAKWRSAVCAFPWGLRGNPTLYGCWRFDPSMLMTHPMVYLGGLPRERKLVLATRERQRGFVETLQKGPWPVEEHGMVTHGRRPIELRDLVARYLSCWGAAVPPYASLDGSGYWRCRYVHMAQCRSLFVTSELDAKVMDAELFGHDSAHYDQFSDRELEELSEEQSDWFFSHCWSLRDLVTEADEFVRRSV